jgi:tetratricopeptide (TPR) repeat protein
VEAGRRVALFAFAAFALTACGKTDWDARLDAVLQERTGSTEQYIEGLQAFLEEGPPTEYASEARFTLGWVYAETLHQYAEARRWFEELLENDPDGNFSEDARWMLDNMEKDDEELLEEIRRRAAELGTGADEAHGTPPPGGH